MLVTVQKWGNSLGVRIPKSFTKDTNIEEGTEVDMSLDRGTIILRPVSKIPSLSELLCKVTKDNIHNETDTGEALGREAW